MLITINSKSTDPLYLQIYNSVISAIALGELVKGKTLPSTRKLAKDLGINYHTVNKAYGLLEQEGIVTITRKKVEVLGASKEGRGEFLEKWRIIEMELIAEAEARGIERNELLRLFKEIIESRRRVP